MKIIAALLITILPVTATASEIYFGFVIGLLSRSGMLIGYRIDDENSIEAHFGGLPHNVTVGLSLKQTNQSKEYWLLGYSAVNQWGAPGGPDTRHGLNFGVGRTTSSADSDWRQSVEFGGGPAYDFKNGRWGSLMFFGLTATKD